MYIENQQIKKNISIWLLLMFWIISIMIVVGGLGSIHGAFFGAAILTLLPVLIAFIRDVTASISGFSFYNLPGLETFIFSVLVIFFILFEPAGVYGGWRKLRLFLELFPLGRQSFFSRQRSFLKTDRLK